MNSPISKALVTLFLFFALAASPDCRAQVAVTVTFNATANDLTTLERDQFTSHAQAAGARWGQMLEINQPRSIEVEIGVANIGTADGASLTSAFVGVIGGRDTFEWGVAHELRTGVDPNGAVPDVRFRFGLDYLRNELWFDPDPFARTAPVPQNRTDAMTIFLHEFGHTIAYNAFSNGQGIPPATFWAPYDSWMQPGTPTLFQGPVAITAWGSAPDLTTNNIAHLGNGARRQSAAMSRPMMIEWRDGVPVPPVACGDLISIDRPEFLLRDDPLPGLLSQLMNGVTTVRGYRYDISPLDMAILEDVGLPRMSAVYPTVLALSPAKGFIAGGTTVTIEGTGFTGTTAVSFGGTIATAVSVISATRIIATTGARVPGVVGVAVTTPGGTNSANTLYTYAVPGPGDLEPLNLNVTGSFVFASAVQPDGKTVIGGDFGAVLGEPRNNIARLNADGTLDTGFNPNVNGPVNSIAVQADGQILLGGFFNSVAGTARSRVARVAANGTLDVGFNPNVNIAVRSVALQADGQVLIGGDFTMVNGAARNLFARLVNDPALQTLGAVNPTQVLWSRGGSVPELSQATFELSTNGGVSYTPLGGTATRVGNTANWQLSGLSLPASGQLRARGRTNGGFHNGSSGLVEQVAVFSGLTLTIFASGFESP